MYGSMTATGKIYFPLSYTYQPSVVARVHTDLDSVNVQDNRYPYGVTTTYFSRKATTQNDYNIWWISIGF